MRRLLLILTLVFVAPAQAALVNNGSFTADTSSGLDWLDLSATAGLSVNDALAANSGWRLATSNEVQGLFGALFPDYYPNLEGESSTSTKPHYDGQLADVQAFQNLFGYNRFIDGIDYTYGIYLDDNSVYRFIGVFNARDVEYHRVYGYFGEDGTDVGGYAASGKQEFGTFLVRSSVVPIPAAVWLFGSALVGMGVFRRRA